MDLNLLFFPTAKNNSAKKATFTTSYFHLTMQLAGLAGNTDVNLISDQIF